MRTLRNIIQSLAGTPRGFNADGRAIDLGLDAALKAQRAAGADVRSIRPARRPAADVPQTRAS